MGYDPRYRGRPLSCEAATRPQERAVLPLMFVYVPGSSGAAFTTTRCAPNSVVSP